MKAWNRVPRVSVTKVAQVAALAVLAAACSKSDATPAGAATTSGAGGAGAADTASSSTQLASVQSVVSSGAVSTAGAGGSGAGGGGAGCDPAPAKGSIYELTDTQLGEVAPTTMCTYAGKVLFIFNAAELCGYTPQTTAIQAIQAKYEAKGLTVLGFYSDDFGNQGGVPATCNAKYGITFDTFDIAPVKGANARPVFAWFGKQTSPGPEKTAEPQWNFSKYLVARNGTWAKHWSVPTLPDAKEVTDAIEAELAK